MPDYAPFTAALAETGQPGPACDALCRLTEATLGVKLFTLMSFDFASGVAERFYSNMPDAYPVSGTKPVNTTDWARQVLEEKRCFVANDIDGIAAVFDDHPLIRSLGCEAVVNIPIVLDGHVAGTVNCLHEAGFYTDDRLRAGEALKLPAAACFLLQQQAKNRGAA
ncbi:GAF domain-containing protein [Aquibium sp. A9E412]|uniref:GAF domain-containing protein n=1 Tax=Aquibium sp. A9E412 TaxID=2976767 RepID=UPI0025B0B29A|nr:GAF domain-containing protein [Aquibium sp. A9E412]MDN2565415.1 GAF domain-containing protein [Aquibium sp. A9E412]